MAITARVEDSASAAAVAPPSKMVFVTRPVTRTCHSTTAHCFAAGEATPPLPVELGIDRARE